MIYSIHFRGPFIVIFVLNKSENYYRTLTYTPKMVNFLTTKVDFFIMFITFVHYLLKLCTLVIFLNCCKYSFFLWRPCISFYLITGWWYFAHMLKIISFIKILYKYTEVISVTVCINVYERWVFGFLKIVQIKQSLVA